MSKILLLRIYNDNTIGSLYSDGLTIKELEALIPWIQERISQKIGMGEKRE